MQVGVVEYADQVADMFIVLFLHLIAQTATFGCEGNEHDTTITRIHSTGNEVVLFQTINNAGHVALVREQDATQIHHRTPLLFVQMLERPILARAQLIFREELAITIIQQDEGFGEQAIDRLLNIGVITNDIHNSDL